MALFEPISEALARVDVRYVVVGGVALVLHGHARLTADLDLAIDLEPDAARRAIRALTDRELRPRAPVRADDFADPTIPARWKRERDMLVFSFVDPSDPLRAVNLFVDDPIAFEQLYERSVRMDVAGIPVRVASIGDLITLKQQAGRIQDEADIAALRELEELGGPTVSTPRSGPDGWEQHRREQVLAVLRATPTERLRWLEQAIRFASRVGALPRSTPPARRSSPSAGNAG